MGFDGDGCGEVVGVALSGKREQFARLIARGVSNAEGRRIVGVHRRTGTRWRYGRTVRVVGGRAVHYPPVMIPRTLPVARSARYLSVDERGVIADLVRAGRSIRSIAGEVGRSPSTVSRELRRNADGRGRYLANGAEHAARLRLARPRRRRLELDLELQRVIVELLESRWSPEQIRSELCLRFPDDDTRQLCTESIYQAIYDDTTPLTRAAWTALRSGRRRRRRQATTTRRRGRLVAMTPISDRPAIVDGRSEGGHWEGDLIMGESNRSAIGTLVERQARFLILIHIPEAH